MLDTFYAVAAAVPTVYDGTADTIPAGATVVMPSHAAVSLQRALQSAGKAPARVSRLGHYTRPYTGQNLNGKRLLAWRGAGVGDQLIFAGCLRYLARRYPAAQIALLVDPRIRRALWDGAENLPFALVDEPLPFADWKAFDHHWLGAGLCDGDREPDQPDVFQGHLQAIGHGDAERAFRYPLVPQSAAWSAQAEAFVQNLPGLCPAPRREGMASPDLSVRGVAESAEPSMRSIPSTVSISAHSATPPSGLGQRPILLWHLAASTPMRSLTPDQTVAALRLLAAERPDVRVILTGTPQQYAEYAAALACPNAAATTAALPIQAIFALCALVNAVVCPDSCLGHVAAEFETPCVSYWCPFPSRVRVASYENHHGLDKTCDCSPCFAHEDGAAVRGCPLAEPDDPAGRFCKGLKAIRPQEIVAKIKEII